MFLLEVLIFCAFNYQSHPSLPRVTTRLLSLPRPDETFCISISRLPQNNNLGRLAKESLEIFLLGTTFDHAVLVETIDQPRPRITR